MKRDPRPPPGTVEARSGQRRSRSAPRLTCRARLGLEPAQAAVDEPLELRLAQLERQRAAVDPNELEEIFDERGVRANLFAQRRQWSPRARRVGSSPTIRSAASPRAVSRITGSSERERIQRQSSSPSVPGSITSSTTRSGFWLSSMIRALAVAGLQRRVAIALEIADDDLADDRLGVHHQTVVMALIANAVSLHADEVTVRLR